MRVLLNLFFAAVAAGIAATPALAGADSPVIVPAICDTQQSCSAVVSSAAQVSRAGGLAVDTFGTDTTQDLSRVLVYPNPFIPYDGNYETGRAFSQGDNTTGIIFANVSPQVDIQIFTVGGRHVTTLGATATGGNLQWDARNDDGRELGTGVYYAVLHSPAGGIAVKKFMIVR